MKIALVLSGGGVKGLAHIGVMQYLEEIGIDISHVSGTSVGALVGMMYASGMRPDAILQYFMETSILSIKNYGFGKPGFLDTMKYESELKSLVGVNTFEELQKKLFISTTNLFTGEERVFSSGDLFKPVLASASFPMVFSPVEIDGEWYADGGIVNNFPTENVPLDVNHIIGVNLNFVSNIDASALTSSFSVMERSFTVMMNSKTKAKSKICSVYISDESLADIGVFEMKKKQMAYDIGYKAAKRQHDEFVKLKDHL